MGGNEPLFFLIMTGFEKAQIIRQNTDLAMTFAYRAKQARLDKELGWQQVYQQNMRTFEACMRSIEELRNEPTEEASHFDNVD